MKKVRSIAVALREIIIDSKYAISSGWWIAAILILLFFFPPPVSNQHAWNLSVRAAASEAEEVQAEGFGTIIEGDIARARDEALRDAYRSAVEAAGVDVEAITEVRDYEIFYDQIITEGNGYVRDYEILNEGETEDGLFKIEIKAEVVSDNLKDTGDELALRRLIELAGDPVVVVIFDIFGENDLSSHFLAGILNEELEDAGFQLVDYEQVRSIWASKNGDVGEIDRAVNVGEHFEADIVLLGEVQLSDRGDVEIGDVTFYGASAHITLQSVSVWTGEITGVWRAEKNEPAGSISEAMRRSAEKAVEELTESVIWELPGDVGVSPEATMTLRVKVEDLPSFSTANQLSGDIEVLRGVESVNLRNFDDGSAAYDVELTGSTEDLAVRMEALDDYELVVTSFGREQLQLKLGN